MTMHKCGLVESGVHTFSDQTIHSEYCSEHGKILLGKSAHDIRSKILNFVMG